MKSIICTAALFCLLFSGAFAQKHYTTTLRKNNGKEVFSLDSADFISVISESDDDSRLFNVQEFYKDKTPKLIAKSKSHREIIYQGQVQTFYRTGKKHEIFNYDNGVKVGDCYEYYPNGKIYTHKKIVPKEKNGEATELLLDCRDSTGAVWASNGEGAYKIFAENFKTIFEQGAVKNGLKDGEWKGDNGDEAHNITFTEQYSNGVLKSGISVYADDNKTYMYSSRFINAAFPGGERALERYVSDNGRYPQSARLNHFSGKVMIEFAVLTDGTIAECNVTASPDLTFSEEAKRLMKLSPKWMPASAFGKPLKVVKHLPFTFGFTARNDNFISIADNDESTYGIIGLYK